MFLDCGFATQQITVTGSWQRFSTVSSSVTVNTDLKTRGDISAQSVDVLVWGAQCEYGSTATPYQRVTTLYDVTEAGVPSCSYLFFDGGSDSMATGSIDFTATDKMTVWAGVRKNSDAARGILAELGTTSAISGSFTIDAPAGATATYRFGTFGASSGVEGTATGFAAPITNVLQMSTNLAGASPATQVSARLNATAATLSLAGSTGGGSYGNFPLHIGYRQSSGSLFFNGNLFGLVVRGAASTTAQITATEQWLAPKTGVTL
jgi:hypothetical protein